MTRRFVVALLVVVLAGSLLGGLVCAPRRPEPGATPANVARLHVGMTREQIKALTGDPEALTPDPAGGESWGWGKKGVGPYHTLLHFDAAGGLESGGMYFSEGYMIALRPRRVTLLERARSLLGL
jgi:hypothetical protein